MSDKISVSRPPNSPERSYRQIPDIRQYYWNNRSSWRIVKAVKDKSGYLDCDEAQGQEAFGLRIAETPNGNMYWIEDQRGRVVFQGRQREQNLIRQLDVLEFLLDWHARKQRWSKSSWWLEWHRQGSQKSTRK